MTPAQARAFVEKHGVVLASARGPVPSLAEAVAGEPIRGSWWGHPAGNAIFHALEAVSEDPAIVVCRLVDKKITLVHRRLWAPLARLARRFPGGALDAVEQEHTASGKHVNHVRKFPGWLPAEVLAEADRLSDDEALAALPSVLRDARRKR